MRKLVLAAVALAVTAAAASATPVKFVKFDEKTKIVTVKTGKKGKEVEKAYTLTDKAKFFEADKAIKLEDAVKKLADSKKPVAVFDIKADGDKVEEVKFTADKKKAKKADKTKKAKKAAK